MGALMRTFKQHLSIIILALISGSVLVVQGMYHGDLKALLIVFGAVPLCVALLWYQKENGIPRKGMYLPPGLSLIAYFSGFIVLVTLPWVWVVTGTYLYILLCFIFTALIAVALYKISHQWLNHADDLKDYSMSLTP